MGALIRMPLRVLLPCLAVSFVAFGAVAAGLAGVSGASGYLMRQADNNVLARGAPGTTGHRARVAGLRGTRPDPGHLAWHPMRGFPAKTRT
jgi:hypothetical protein